MPRDLPVGNGSLLVNFDHTGQIRDIYWPHVGQENHISGTTVGDSAYYEPERQALFHYKGKRWFMTQLHRGRPDNRQNGLDQWAIGSKDIRDLEGSWKDAEDGRLSGNPVAQGSIDSVCALHLELGPKGRATGWYSLAVGVDHAAVSRISHLLDTRGPIAFLERTAAYWQLWVTKGGDSFPQLPEDLSRLYRRSLLILRTQIDNQGAIIAANDHDIAQFNRDTYSYMWPRDGALVTASLIHAGYSEISRRFFDFCHKVITEQGFLLHKYTPDGSLASSWHTWDADGTKQLPIQEDETALVIWALWRHFDKFRDIEFIKCHYRGLITRAANWMCTYVDQETGLPLPSWDLWEERYGVHSWTVAAVWAGLTAAADFAGAFGENKLALKYQRAAGRMKQATEKYLWHDKSGCFCRSLLPENGANIQDTTMDASLIGLWYFGMFGANHPRIVQTMEAMRKRLSVRTEVGGIARYENDYYHQISDDIAMVPGNPWFICTLWFSQWQIATAATEQDLQSALELIQWTADHTLYSGVMAEQVHPFTNAPLSVSPLTWSHATYVATLLEYRQKSEELTHG